MFPRGRLLVEMAVRKETKGTKMTESNKKVTSTDTSNLNLGKLETTKRNTKVSDWIHNSNFHFSEPNKVRILQNVSIPPAIYPLTKDNESKDYLKDSTSLLHIGNEDRFVSNEILQNNMNLSFKDKGEEVSVLCDSVNNKSTTNIYDFDSDSCGNGNIYYGRNKKSSSGEINSLQDMSAMMKNEDSSNKETKSETKILQNNIDPLSEDSDSYDDDSRDKDFNISDCTSETSSSKSSENVITERDDQIDIICKMDPIYEVPPPQPMSEKIMGARRKKKEIRCKYCDADIQTKNFKRHLERHHASEKEVKNALQYPKNSKERRRAFELLRNETNFDLFIKGVVRPKRDHSDSINTDYYPCVYCKGLFMKQYLRRHAKNCTTLNSYNDNRNVRINHLSRSQTMTACASDPSNVISNLNVKEQVFDIMKGDSIAYEAKKDVLIACFGNSYLKKHRRERMAYACSTRMRELSRLLIHFRIVVNNENISLKDMLRPQHFDDVISAVRHITGYDSTKKTFKSPSLAMHLGTSLKLACDELTHMILKESSGFRCTSIEERKIWLNNVKNFRKLCESRWNIELGSLANKDLQEKRWTKPLLLPLVSDVKKFRDGTLMIANNSKQLFHNNEDDQNAYKELVQCVLSLLIVFNRRRIGDVQFLKIKDYQLDKRSDCTDFNSLLTESEKILTKKYRRVINSGKGSRAVVILIPELLQDFIAVILENRSKYIPPDNEYLFAMPGSKIKWGKGDVAIRTLTKKIKLDNPQAFSSNKLRKQIATVMQILNLTQDEAKQFSDFMGHTQKTHAEFYELPIDIYQTAKVSKILLMMEKGHVPEKYKGSSLRQINFDVNLEYAEENDSDGGEIALNPDPHLNEISQIEELDRILCKEDNTIDGTSDNMYNIAPGKLSNNKMRTETIIDQVADSDDSEAIEKIKRSKQRKCRSWLENETKLLQSRFKRFIDTGTYPSTSDIKQFLRENKINRGVANVKSKVQHLIRLKSKK